MQIKAFIKYYWGLFCFATKGAWGKAESVSGILALILGYIGYKHPEWGTTMNNLLWMIPVAIFLVLFAIRWILAPYEKYKEQKEEIEKLQVKTFFEKNANMTIKGLENNIKEIENWFKYIKEHPRFVCQELREVTCDKILFSFIPTDESIIEKTIGDCFPKILLFLRDYKPNLGNDIKTQYDNIQKQLSDIIDTCEKDSALTSEQEKSIASSYIAMTRLKNSMKKLVADLRDCVEIAKEERK